MASEGGFAGPHHITTAATVDLFDASHGVFGELIDPRVVLDGIRLSDNVGRLDDPVLAKATQSMRSFTCPKGEDETCIEFDNVTAFPVIVRWVDEKGQFSDRYNFDIDPFSSTVRYSRLGHLFVVSIQIPTSEENFGSPEQEQMLGAYRIRMTMPSGSPHYVLIEHEPLADAIRSFLVETALSDPTGGDEMIVAAASLDAVEAGPDRAVLAKTVKTLSTIVRNVLDDPDEAKFRTLRLSNPAIRNAIGSRWGARQMLHCVGFREADDDHLTLEIPENDDGKPRKEEGETQRQRLERASELLDELRARLQPGFVAELAPSPPWQGPVLTSTGGAGTSFNTEGTHFLSDDEKWERAERNRKRRGRGGRRPSPGNAPSSKGRWGR